MMSPYSELRLLVANADRVEERSLQSHCFLFYYFIASIVILDFNRFIF